MPVLQNTRTKAPDQSQATTGRNMTLNLNDELYILFGGIIYFLMAVLSNGCMIWFLLFAYKCTYICLS